MVPFELLLLPSFLILSALCLAVYDCICQRERDASPPLLPQHRVSTQYTQISSVVVERRYPETRPSRPSAPWPPHSAPRPPYSAPRPPQSGPTAPVVGSRVTSSTSSHSRTHPREVTPWNPQLPDDLSAQPLCWADIHRTIQSAEAARREETARLERERAIRIAEEARLDELIEQVRLERERAVRIAEEARLAELVEQARPAPEVRGQQPHHIPERPQARQVPEPVRGQEAPEVATPHQGDVNSGRRRARRGRHRDTTPVAANPEVLPKRKNFQTHNGSDDPVYLDLRTRAIAARDDAQNHFKNCDAARARGDRAREKVLRSAGKGCQKEAERLNAEASARVFEQMNRGSSLEKVDLHGLYVKEAKRYALQSLENALNAGLPTLTLIVGKGTHAADGVPKIKPAIEQLMIAKGYEPKSPPGNSGVLIIQLRPLTSRL